MKTGVNVSSSRTYSLTLSHRVDVSVGLTGMTTDFDCTVSGNRCTNRGGTRDDSWSGTLNAGDHKIVVYPYGGGSGDYTLTVSAQTPSTGGSTGTRTQVTTLVDASETNISASRTYSFTLERAAEVDVALTGLTIDFDCRVGSSRCTNRWGTLDDSWSDDLAAGDHSVVVYPYDPGPGDYSLTVTATETVTHVATPLGGGPPRIRLSLCEEDDGRIVEGTCREVVTGAAPGQGNPGPGDGGGGGGDDDDDEETPEPQLDNAVADALEKLGTCRVQNHLLDGDIDEYNPSSQISAAQAAGNILDEIPHEGASCSNPLEPVAHVDAIPGGTEIHICPPFYSLSAPHQSRTIIHEGLHLMDILHEAFLLPNGQAAQDGRQMDESISASCYSQ